MAPEHRPGVEAYEASYEDTAAELSEEAYASRAGTGEPRQLAGWVSSYEAIAAGETSVTSDTIEAVTGRRPWTLAEFLRAEPASWAHLRRG